MKWLAIITGIGIAFVTVAAIFILQTSQIARAENITLPEFEKEITWSYTVKYKYAQDLTKLPFALRILDAELPEKLAIILRPSKMAGLRAVSILIQAQNRNGASTSTEDIVAEQNGALKWMRMEQRMKSGSGEVIHEEIHYVDNPMFNYTQDMFSKECIILCVSRNILRQGKQKEKLTAWVNPILVMTVHAVLSGNEKVSVPAGTFDTAFIELKPLADDYFGPKAGPVVQPFVPSFKAWYEKTSPYRLVKYEGPLGSMPNTKRLYEVWELSK